MYFNRNRFYSPTLGRFVQRDPNETALPILTALATNAETLAVAFGPFDAQALYSNGPNLYQYEASNPVNNRDPSGLYDDYDELIDDLTGQGVALVDYIKEGAGFDLLGVSKAANLVGDILGVTDLYNAGMNILDGQGGFWDYVEVASVLAGPASRAAKGAWKAFKWGRYYLQQGRRNARTISLSYMIIQKLCFPAGTLVLLANGTWAPIECVSTGDEVACDFDPSANNGHESSTVLRTFQNGTAELLELEIDVDGERLCIAATPDHPFYNTAAAAYVAARDLLVGDGLLGLDGRWGVVVGTTRRVGDIEVYNIEVQGAHNYYVAPPASRFGLLVHNRCIGHHTVPTEILNKLPDSVRRAGPVHGMKGQKNIWQMPEELHRKLHAGARGGEWNARWRAEIDAAGGFERVQVDDIVRIREKLVSEYGLEPFRP